MESHQSRYSAPSGRLRADSYAPPRAGLFIFVEKIGFIALAKTWVLMSAQN